MEKSIFKIGKIGKIGKRAIKISCLQVRSGMEIDVSKALISACKQSDVENSFCMKGLGFYDIILMYDDVGFDFRVSNAGPIPGVISSNTFHSFPYLGDNLSDIFNSLEASIFIGISFIKFSDDKPASHEAIEKQIAEYLTNSTLKNSHVLGTIGPSEVILLLCHDNIDSIVHELSRFNRDLEILNCIDKTFSNIAINYHHLPKSQDDCKSIDEVIKSLVTVEGFKTKITREAWPTVKISSKPAYYKEIEEYWTNDKFNIREMLGDYDFIVEPIAETLDWDIFVSYLLCFRTQFKDKINSTATSIEMNVLSSASENSNRTDCIIENGKSEQGQQWVQFDMAELKAIFGSVAPLLANHFYSLNWRLQNPIKRKVFEDMLDYPDRIISIGRKIKEINQAYNSNSGSEETLGYFNKGESLESLAIRSAYAIANGSQLRSYALYGSSEPATGGFSRLRGGAQRAVKAMEYVPAYLLNRINRYWYGFIIVEDPKFSHLNEVISVPTEALWRIEKWWPLYHEVAHIFLTRVDWLEENNEVIKRVLWNKRSPVVWFNFLIELTAEVLGYEFGFFSDFDLFFRLLLQHLIEIDPKQKRRIPVDVYLLRTLFVEMFENSYRNKTGDFKDFDNEECIYGKALNLIGRAEKIYLDYLNGLDEDSKSDQRNHDNNISWCFKNKEFLAARFSSTMKSLSEFASYLNARMLEYEASNAAFTLDRSLLNNNIDEAYKSIKEGYVWRNHLNCPEALLYKLIKEGDSVSFQTSIATILTFCHLSS